MFINRFEENAKIHSQVFKDQLMKSLDCAIYWIEYVIRNGGTRHLKSDSIGLNDAQYFLFDLELVLILFSGLIVWLFYRGVVIIISKLKTN